MRTVCGLARRVEVLIGRGGSPPAPAPRPLLSSRSALLSGDLGEQRRGGARLDQVDATTCGSAVLVALSAWADPTALALLDGGPPVQAPGLVAPSGFGARYDTRQRQVHRETNRFWPQALGTTPWGMVRWLRDNVPAAGPYRVRLVDDVSRSDVEDALGSAGQALAAGRPVPMLVGPLVPRHYVMALGVMGEGWRVYEPTSGSVRELDLDLVRSRRSGPVLGFDRLHALLLPA